MHRNDSTCKQNSVWQTDNRCIQMRWIFLRLHFSRRFSCLKGLERLLGVRQRLGISFIAGSQALRECWNLFISPEVRRLVGLWSVRLLFLYFPGDEHIKHEFWLISRPWDFQDLASHLTWFFFHQLGTSAKAHQIFSFSESIQKNTNPEVRVAPPCASTGIFLIHLIPSCRAQAVFRPVGSLCKTQHQS